MCQGNTATKMSVWKNIPLGKEGATLSNNLRKSFILKSKSYECVVFLLVILGCGYVCDGSKNVYNKVTVDLSIGKNIGSSPFLNHLLVYNDTLYIGAENNIFKVRYDRFGDALIKLEEVSTGPHLDNYECQLPPSTCQKAKTSITNVNKILLLYRDRNQEFIITCGSVYQGNLILSPF